MSEAFTVPEPSEEAIRAYNLSPRPELSRYSTPLRAAYAVDVPGIVKAEVQMALTWAETQRGSYVPAERIATYLSARFPEAAPEGPCMFNFCPTPEKCRVVCQSQNPLRKSSVTISASSHAPVDDLNLLAPTPRGAPEPERCRHEQFGECADCRKRRTMGSVAGSVPEEKPLCKVNCGSVRCAEGCIKRVVAPKGETVESLRQHYADKFPVSCTACACPKHEAERKFLGVFIRWAATFHPDYAVRVAARQTEEGA